MGGRENYKQEEGAKKRQVPSMIEGVYNGRRYIGK